MKDASDTSGSPSKDSAPYSIADDKNASSSSIQNPSSGQKIFTVGTLSYTKTTLSTLFAWLLWGDFCFTLMETVVPSLVPLKLKDLGAPSWLISMIMTSIPAVLNMTICPWVSYKSDRYRSRWGRRIPFILWTMPFLCLCLIMMGWSETLADTLHKHIGFFQKVTPATLAVILIATFMIGFQFFNMFVNSVYWYLFNDVVPSQLLGRFTGMFRFIATGAGMLYNLFIFQFANTHMREIITWASILYFIGFGLMCLRVKEGEYPPVVDMEKETGGQSKKGFIHGIVHFVKNFIKESFESKFYWNFYMIQTFMAVTGAIAIFSVFFNQDMGLSLKQIGNLGAVSAGVSLAAIYLTAIYVDRWHPLRIMAYIAIFNAVGGFSGYAWVLMTLPAAMFFWLGVSNTITLTFGNVLNSACFLPAFMRLMPRSRYGQICSAAAMVRSVGTFFAGILAGLFMDLILYFCDGTGFAYRFIFLWSWLCNIILAVFIVIGYRQWHQLGGDKSYLPPAPWDPSGVENANDNTPTKPMSLPLMKLSLKLYNLTFILKVISIPLLMIMMWRYNMHSAVYWYATWVWPPLLLAMLCWMWQMRSVWRDVHRFEQGLQPRNGIPHHGVLMVMSVESLVGILILWWQSVWMILEGLEEEVKYFGTINVVLGSLAVLLVLYAVCRMERGLPPVGLQPAASPPPTAEKLGSQSL